MSWPDWERCFRSMQPYSLSSFISRIHSFLFSNWEPTVSSKYFDAQVPSIFTEELVLPRHACCVLSRICCNRPNLLLSSYLSRIGRIEKPSCSAYGHSSQDTSHLILHCPATDSLRRSLFGDSLFLYQWRLVVEFAGGAASHFLIFLLSLYAVYLPLFSYKCANFPKLCAVLVVGYNCIQSGIACFV